MNKLLAILLVFGLVLFGCPQEESTTTEYVCLNGSVVSDSTSCTGKPLVDEQEVEEEPEPILEPVDINTVNFSNVQESGIPIRCVYETEGPYNNTPVYRIELYISGSNFYKNSNALTNLEYNETQIIYNNTFYTNEDSFNRVDASCDWRYFDLDVYDACYASEYVERKFKMTPSEFLRSTLFSWALSDWESIEGECFYGGFGDEVFIVSGKLCEDAVCQEEVQ